MVRFLASVGRRENKPMVPRKSARNDITRRGGFAPGEPPQSGTLSPMQPPNQRIQNGSIAVPTLFQLPSELAYNDRPAVMSFPPAVIHRRTEKCRAAFHASYLLSLSR